jgi:hypothetical protein
MKSVLKWLCFIAIAVLVIIHFTISFFPLTVNQKSISLSKEKLVQLNNTLIELKKELQVFHQSLFYNNLSQTNLGLSSNNKYKTVQSLRRKWVLIFTMDSIHTYELNSLRGGAAGKFKTLFQIIPRILNLSTILGEILIRKCLEYVFVHEFDMKVDVIKSDEEFDKIDANLYEYIILDPWTWAGKGYFFFSYNR